MLSTLGSHSLGLDAASKNLKAIGIKCHRVNPERHKTSWSGVSTRHLLSAAGWVSCCISSDNRSIPACVCVFNNLFSTDNSLPVSRSQKLANWTNLATVFTTRNNLRISKHHVQQRNCARLLVLEPRRLKTNTDISSIGTAGAGRCCGEAEEEHQTFRLPLTW